jgi:putative transposase
MPARLKRRYGGGNLHFITCSCYRRMAFFRTARARDVFLKVLAEVRDRYHFALVGCVVMPEHFHLLMSEAKTGTPSTVMQVLKQRVSRKLRRKQRRKRTSSSQLRLWQESPMAGPRSFWQSRFYDFNVYSRKKKIEKVNYMHLNPVKRGLVSRPEDWAWSSYAFYAGRESRIRFDRVD